MKKIALVLLLITLIPFVTSCTAPYEAIKGMGKGVGSVGEGAARGTLEAGKGVGGAAGYTTKATAEALTGRGDEAADSGKSAIEAGAEGIKGAVVETIKGVEQGLKHIDEGIRRSTGEDIK